MSKKIRYIVDMDLRDGNLEVITELKRLKDAIEDLLKLENKRCVQYYLDGMSMKQFLEHGKEIQAKLDDLFDV